MNLSVVVVPYCSQISVPRRVMSLTGTVAALPTADRAREMRDMDATTDFMVVVGTGVQDR